MHEKSLQSVNNFLSYRQMKKISFFPICPRLLYKSYGDTISWSIHYFFTNQSVSVIARNLLSFFID